MPTPQEPVTGRQREREKALGGEKANKKYLLNIQGTVFKDQGRDERTTKRIFDSEDEELHKSNCFILQLRAVL